MRDHSYNPPYQGMAGA